MTEAISLPGGSQVEAYGTFVAERGYGKWRRIALVAATIAACALIAVAVGTPRGTESTELDESQALSLASSYFHDGAARKESAQKRIEGIAAAAKDPARMQDLSMSNAFDNGHTKTDSAAASLGALEKALSPAEGRGMKAAAAPVAEDVVPPVQKRVVASAQHAAGSVGEGLAASAVAKPAVHVHHVGAHGPAFSDKPKGGIATGIGMRWRDKSVPSTDGAKAAEMPQHVDVMDDDKRVRVLKVARQQALAQKAAPAKKQQLPAAIRQADGKGIELPDPFSDVTKKGVVAKPGHDTMWFN